jgi:hypothetical protein
VEPDHIRRLVSHLGSGRVAEEGEAWEQLRPLGEAVVPYLAEFYADCTRWQGRNAALYYSTRHVRRNETAFQLGLKDDWVLGRRT